MSEIAKRLEKAEKYLQKGKLSSALDELREALREEPEHEIARQRAADICISLELTAEAGGYLGEIFDHAAATGRGSEAISTYKKLARLTPPTDERTLKYAKILERSAPREALDAYRSALESFVRRGDKRKAHAALKQIVALEPSIENRRLEAEMAESMGDERGAALAYLEIGHMEENSGHDPSEAYERAYSLDMENPNAALAHARCLMRASRAEQAVAVLQLQTLATLEYYDTYAQALLLANRPELAEPVVIKLYDSAPTTLPLVGELFAAYMRQGQSREATDFAHSIESKIRAHNGMRDYLAMIREIVDKQNAGTDFLEYLAHLYNTSNREHEYCDTLLKLFELYFAERGYMKAAECLDRASEVDAYEPGHAERLEMLRGKIDANKFNAISSRLASVSRNTAAEDDLDAEEAEAAEAEPEKPQEPTILEDLMLQAEIFLQYSMRSKAVERLERINKLFPHEEDKREKLAQLYAAAGYSPRYEDGTTTRVAGTAAVANEEAVDNFAKVTEITRNISRQSSVKSVLFTTVNDVGRHWNVSRCVAGLSAPGKAPSAAMEYCAPGVAKSDVMGLAKLISTLQGQAVKTGGPVSYEEAEKAPELEGIRAVLAAQRIASLVAVPMKDGDEHVGIVILEQCGATRVFRKVDTVVLNTIAEQIVIAVNNARLRSLVKSLAPTDEKSGLMRRSSYLDVLLSEVQRGLTQKSATTLVLMSFGSASALIKEAGEANVEAAMQEVGHTVSAQIRQNDIAVRYGLTMIALILADTNDKNAFFVLEKLRGATSNIKVPGRSEPLVMTAGIAELVMQPKFEAVDIVTEGINRVETALEIARHEGGNKAHAMAPVYEGSAVSA
jgi:GGDEF domain-containing protein/tetratricopeptide (TPR) repeat protein